MSIRVVVALLVLVFSARMSAADPDPGPRLHGKVVDSHSSMPVEGARVIVVGPAGTHEASTGRTGQYSVEVPPGRYDVEFTYGNSRTRGKIVVEPGLSAKLDGAVDSSSGEVIVIQDRYTPGEPPVPINHIASKTPPYSDTAVLQDAWTRAWVLLEITPTGEVARFKFLKKPGYDLERIAAAEVFRLKFAPGRDSAGHPVTTWLLWGIEWPSRDWMVERLGVTSGMPPTGMARNVPCRGSGPMSLTESDLGPQIAGQGRVDSHYSAYRDCSTPEPYLANARAEPWITRPATPADAAK